MATATATATKPKTETKPQAQGVAAADIKTVNVPATQNVRSVLYSMSERFGMEPQAFEATLRHTVIPKDCSREQFAAFLLVAKEYDLNPLLKEIYAFPAKGGGIQPIVGVDGWSNLINSHPAFDGMDFEDEIDSGGNVISITCRIHRKDRAHLIAATEYMAECKRATEPWQKWPRRMLRHKAMIQCARYAFGFAGIVDPDEAERFSADTARDVTPRRIASTAAAFGEFAKPVEAEPTGFPEEDKTDGDTGGEFEDELPAGDPPSTEAKKPDQAPADQPGAKAPPPAGDKPSDPPPSDGQKPTEPKTQAPPLWSADKEPANEAEYEQYAAATVAGITVAADVKDWFVGDAQRALRNKVKVSKDAYDRVREAATQRINDLQKLAKKA